MEFRALIGNPGCCGWDTRAPYRFQALVTSLPPSTPPPLAVWRYYNGRADCENVIKELQTGFARPTLCLEQFWASEAARSLDSLTYNLIVLFERHLGLAAQSDAAESAVLAVRDRRCVEPSGGQDDHQAGRAKTRTGLVVTLVEKDFEPYSQLQCS